MRYELMGMAFLLVSYFSFGVHYQVKSKVFSRLLMGLGYITMLGVFVSVYLSFF